MESYQNILVVIDPTADEQKALARACILAQSTGAKITAHLTIYDFSYEMTTMLSGEEREAMRQTVINDRELWLKDLVAAFNQDISVKVEWHNRPFESILNAVKDFHYDIIIKSTHEHPTLQSVIFTPTDWHLIRKSWVPLLLVKDHQWPEGGHILAAINAGSEEAEHQSLNDKISEEAFKFSRLVNADVNFVNSYPGTPINIAIEIPEFDANEYNDAMKQHHLDVMKKHADKYGIEDKYLHVREGLPEDVIEAVAEEIDAELVILGTVGRTGLSAVLIGNTAEHVIDRLNCDLLALKPVGYESPFLK